jgi:hypothetical protein
MNIMKKLLLLGLMLMVFSIIPSCKKDNPETDVDEIEKEIIALVNNNAITKCSIFLNYGAITAAQNMDFSISGGCVIITQSLGDWTIEDRYNLLHLSRYEISIAPTNKTIDFYFE